MDIESVVRVLGSYWRLWATGAAVTLGLSVIAIVCGTAVGLVLAVLTTSRVSIVRMATRLYSDIMQAIPALVLIGTMYFVLPTLTGWRISAFTVAAVALSLNLSPFASE